MTKLNINTAREVVPVCYAYTTPGVIENKGWTKIGYTERDAALRIKEQTYTAGIKTKIEWQKNAIYEGSNETFTDKDFHGYLSKLGYSRRPGLEWFKIDPKLAGQKFNDFRENKGIVSDNLDPLPYKLRREQEEAVQMTINYFKTHDHGEFLWNAKPRFGKTISAYDLCMAMGFKNILVVTNRPAIANSWYEDYEKFIGLNSGYRFVSHVDSLKDRKYVVNRDEYIELLGKNDRIKGCIEFVSLQDIKGSKYFNADSTTDKLRELSNQKDANGNPIGVNWDILIIDEAHEGVDTYKTDMAFDHIGRKNTLHLSGTPFKTLANDKFPADAIYNWTYADEQEAKASWDNTNEEENPYETLPQLNLFTYKMSDLIRNKLEDGIDLNGESTEYAFDLNEFFSTGENKSFVYSRDVDKFLDALVDQEKFPFSTEDLRNKLKHTLWILDRVDSAKAMANRLKRHPIFRDYEIVLAAGDGRLDDDDEYMKSYDKVVDAISKYDKTITLSVGQLTTGVTIPQWTGVLILSNMKSPALYMQAAFRSQNPYIYRENGKTYRKENAYVFDFDPARTLTIFEEFANDLYTHTSGGRGDIDTRKKQVRELLNFFPIYGEDEDGSMVELDAESVLTIPRRIHAVEVVNRGFMSNFLFANIGNIFGAPREVTGILERIKGFGQGKDVRKGQVDESVVDDLNLNDNYEVEIPEEQVIGKEKDLFGKKVYGEIKDKVDDITKDPDNNEAKEEADILISKNKVEDIKDKVANSFKDSLISRTKEVYADKLSKSCENQLERNIKKSTDKIIDKEYGKYQVETTLIESQRQEQIKNAKSSHEATTINEKFEKDLAEKRKEFLSNVKVKISDDIFVEETGQEVVRAVETDQRNKEKREYENGFRDHLRGFARTIPSFLMAYGNEDTTLVSFDSIIPDKVFQEVTSISLKEFRFLRDGGDYIDEKTGETKHFEGKLFDEIVFDDAVLEFLRKKDQLKNYFDESSKRDIFDYIPPQQTNQIFTPKKVVKEMVDLLEEENPGCFDDPTKTFADLYMKSGLYIAEIVKRLYRSEKMKEIFPDDTERLNHIFKNQVYGLAPSEIIYQIALNFVLGFSDDIKIDKHNLKMLDSLKCIQKGNLEDKLDEIFH